MGDEPEEKGYEITKWADRAMFEAAPMAGTEPRVHLLWATPDPLGAVAAMCRMYEGKPTYNLYNITDEEREHYWEQVQRTHLKAPLESIVLHFFIEGVTRAFTHQMVRQRTAVYAQESLRFAVKENMAGEASMPPSVKTGPTARREIWNITLEKIEDSYNRLIADGVPAEDARGLLPHATTTRLNYVTNLRNLIEHAGNRLCTQAQFEWRAVFISLVKAVRDYEPPRDQSTSKGWGPQQWQFQHMVQSAIFKPVCFQLGHCPFTAVFDTQCTIRSRVRAGKFDEIDPNEYMSDPTAGRRD
jgi:flavin-dependent thymidylate synthase